MKTSCARIIPLLLIVAWPLPVLAQGWTANPFQITTDPARQYAPAIYDNTVLWIDERNDEDTPDIYSYDLATHTEAPSAQTDTRLDSPAIWGNMAAWQDLTKSQMQYRIGSNSPHSVPGVGFSGPEVYEHYL